jgi:hypothetical protein
MTAKRLFLRNLGEFLRNSVASPKFWRAQHRLQQLILAAFAFNHRPRPLADKSLNDVDSDSARRVPAGAAFPDQLSFDSGVKGARTSRKRR